MKLFIAIIIPLTVLAYNTTSYRIKACLYIITISISKIEIKVYKPSLIDICVHKKMNINY